MAKKLLCVMLLSLLASGAHAQGYGFSMDSIPRAADYVLKRASSADPLGANNDARPIPPGGTLTLLDWESPARRSRNG